MLIQFFLERPQVISFSLSFPLRFIQGGYDTDSGSDTIDMSTPIDITNIDQIAHVPDRKLNHTRQHPL